MNDSIPSSDLDDDLIPLLEEVMEDSETAHAIAEIDLADLPLVRQEIIDAVEPKLELLVDAVAEKAAEKIARRVKRKLMEQLPEQLPRLVDRELVKRFGKK